jgi:hypothetical protein
MKPLHLVVIPAALILLLGCSTSTINKENYAKLKEGMSYKEVVEILGNPTDEINSSSPGGMETHTWKSDSAVIILYFQNERIVMKSGTFN